jgi:sugar lactone lactonase YvrE
MADPVIAVDKEGRVLHSFGKGLYKIPHAIRLDPEGNVWTVDAGGSTVIKFSPKGEKLLQIEVGGLPEPALTPFAEPPILRLRRMVGFSSATVTPTPASSSTRSMARSFASGAVRARVRGSSICRTRS